MMPTRPTGRRRLLLVVLVLLSALSAAPAADQPQWGQRYSRNMVSDEKGLPDRFDPKTGENVKWSAAIGSQCWATPVVAGGKVLIGTNNSQPRDPKHEGDRGVLMCLNEADGSFAWQLVVPKLSEDMLLRLAPSRDVLAAHRRRRPGLHAHQSRRSGLPRSARHGQRQRWSVSRRRPAHGAGRPAGARARSDGCRHPLAAGFAHRRGRPAARFDALFDPPGRLVPVREHEQRADQPPRRRGQAERTGLGGCGQSHRDPGRPGTRRHQPADFPLPVVLAGAGYRQRPAADFPGRRRWLVLCV